MGSIDLCGLYPFPENDILLENVQRPKILWGFVIYTYCIIGRKKFLYDLVVIGLDTLWQILSLNCDVVIVLKTYILYTTHTLK